MALTPNQRERFNRTILLEGIGEAGQERLLASRVLIIGAGGLGSAAALYLAAAGAGTLGIADGDKVELSNLQRQILHETADIGSPKVASAERRLSALNPQIHVVKHGIRIDETTAAAVIADYDFVIDATDNLGSKFLINDACVRCGVPFSHAGVLAFLGQAMTVVPGQSACYRCVFPEPPPASSQPRTSHQGILGSIAGILGAIQATECIKYLCGIKGLLTDRLFVCDGKSMECRTVDVRKRPACRACGRGD